ncbi:MAG: tRNA (N6-threonylcarbamoyladenosine(37)-N6)-methyltransferase TrmO [Anaerolineales bacterium]|nr:tRNA (N6-threonylcarbamoyladenosine(37)-N6)-methyltransferase TrmO [Anaerolineales bacterium]
MLLATFVAIQSLYKTCGDAPRQGRLSDGMQVVEVFAEYAAGLEGIEQAARLIVLYWGDRAKRNFPRASPPFHPHPVGVFASRSPNRPNPIALCIADLVKRDGNQLTVRGVDALDGRPLLDLKPNSPSLDFFPEPRTPRTHPDDRTAPAEGFGDG